MAAQIGAATVQLAGVVAGVGASTEEEPGYLSRQLITCLGNKRALLGPIGLALAEVKKRLGRERIAILDAFAGSGVVSRFFKRHASRLVSNDIEDFAVAMARCFLRNRSSVDGERLRGLAEELCSRVDGCGFDAGFIEGLYSPVDEARITRKDRVFYTRRNARRLDNYRRMLDTLAEDERQMLLGPLLSEASIHANTAGVFKGFYKDRETKIGRFGGTNADALSRIKGEIRLQAPVLSRFECDVEVFQEDANALVRRVRGLDLAYFDPPYNQHPYGSNYFMLNLLVGYRRPERISRVSGIPVDWRRSDYNILARSLTAFRDLVENVDARFILVSFNDEGFIRPQEMEAVLGGLGPVEKIEIRYNAFRGSRNMHNRKVHVTEQLFLVERA